MHKNVKFHFWFGYNTAQDGRLGIVQRWHQYKVAGFSLSLPQLFLYVEEETCVNGIMTGNVECSQ